MKVTRRATIRAGGLVAAAASTGCSSYLPSQSAPTTAAIQGFDVEIVNQSADVDTVSVALESESGDVVFSDETVVGPSSTEEFDGVIPATEQPREYTIHVELDNGERSAYSFSAARDTHFVGIVVTIQEDDSVSVGAMRATE